MEPISVSATMTPLSASTPPLISPKKSSEPSAKQKTLAANAPKTAKKQRYKKIPKDERKNNKGWAEGRREALLRQMLPAFIKARQESWQAEGLKLKEIQNCYHHHFPYPMKDSDEPGAEMVVDLKMTNPPVPPSLSPEEEKKRLDYIAEYNKRIMTWLKRAAASKEPGASTTGRNEVEVLLRQILATLNPVKKKARSVVQHWLHLNWTEGAQVCDIVAERWNNRVDTSVEDEPPNFRVAVAKELFEKLPENERDSWHESTKEYNAKMKAGKDDEVSKDAVEIAATL